MNYNIFEHISSIYFISPINIHLLFNFRSQNCALNIAAYIRLVRAVWNHEIHSVDGVRLKSDVQSEMLATKIHRISVGFHWALDINASILNRFYPIESPSDKWAALS